MNTNDLMDKYNYEGICNIISANIGNRKLALRWKNSEIEKAIYENCGLKADCYFSLDKKRCLEEDTIH